MLGLEPKTSHMLGPELYQLSLIPSPRICFLLNIHVCFFNPPLNPCSSFGKELLKVGLCIQ